MKTSATRHQCLVCGYPDLLETPRSKSGGGSYEICPSCGYQFGVDDDDRRISFAEHREQWKRAGMKWSSRGVKPPAKWDPVAQLATLG